VSYREVSLAPVLKLADKHFRRLGNGALLLFRHPGELPRNALLLARYLWHVQVRRKSLVVLARPGGLGDLVCVLASVPGLRDRHPHSWLVALTPPGCWQLAASSGLIDAAGDPGGFFETFVNRMSSPSQYYRPLLPDEYLPPRPQLLHLADEFAREIGVIASPAPIHFAAPNRVRRRIERRLKEINHDGRPLIVFHAGPTWPVREWPAQRWNELAELVSAKTSAIMIRIGTDRDSMRRLRVLSPIPDVLDWINMLDVVETVALLENASAFVGIDSGPLHVAAALGIPSVALFGPISGRLRMQAHARAIVVTGEVGCLGCHHRAEGPLHWRTGCPHDMACMDHISAEKVFRHLVEALSHRGSFIQRG
jgi:ADP-heptose:LPS heptosyltransferase